MGKISNITNSNDPQSINSRIFVGNLNTFMLNKDDVERIFKRYGRIIGISMHKGYAFVQYTNEYDARNAVAGEDQRIYASQPIDVNMAAEPKPNRPSRKRPPGAGSEWDYYYNAPVRAPLAPPLKRPRPDLGPMLAMNMKAPHLKRTLVPIGGAAAAAALAKARMMPKLRMKGRGGMPAKVQPKPAVFSYEAPDILICGNCKQLFPDVERLSAHKRVRCKLRFLCRCNEESAKQIKGSEPLIVSCASCHLDFASCWDLIQHAQSEHGQSIFDEQKVQFNNTGDGSSVGEGGNEDGEEESTGAPSQETESDMGVDEVVEGTSDGIALFGDVESENGGDDVEAALQAAVLAQECTKDGNNEAQQSEDEDEAA